MIIWVFGGRTLRKLHSGSISMEEVIKARYIATRMRGNKSTMSLPHELGKCRTRWHCWSMQVCRLDLNRITSAWYGHSGYFHTCSCWYALTIAAILEFNLQCSSAHYNNTFMKQTDWRFSGYHPDPDNSFASNSTVSQKERIQENQRPYVKLCPPYSRFYFWFSMSSTLGSLCKKSFK